MKRLEFIPLLGGAAAALPLRVNAQPSAKIPRIGLMVTGSLESPEARVQLDAFRQGLRQLGYTEGRNIAIEYRGADARIERFPNLAAELVRLEVDLIFAANTPAALAARQATTTIPIVAAVMGDPVEDGLVAVPTGRLSQVGCEQWEFVIARYHRDRLGRIHTLND